MTRKKVKSGVRLGCLGVKLPPDIVELIGALGAQEERSKSWIGRKLLERGLAAYRRDGRFDDAGSKGRAGE